MYCFLIIFPYLLSASRLVPAARCLETVREKCPTEDITFSNRAGSRANLSPPYLIQTSATSRISSSTRKPIETTCSCSYSPRFPLSLSIPPQRLRHDDQPAKYCLYQRPSSILRPPGSQESLFFSQSSCSSSCLKTTPHLSRTTHKCLLHNNPLPSLRLKPLCRDIQRQTRNKTPLCGKCARPISRPNLRPPRNTLHRALLRQHPLPPPSILIIRL
jgi:hypothetical protein